MSRSKKFKTVEELQRLIDGYFKECEDYGEPVTITGLALYLDTTRETLMDYQRKGGYSEVVKRAKQRVEFAYEKRLIKRGNAGDIFALKQFGWKDRIEQEVSSPQGAPFTVKVIS